MSLDRYDRADIRAGIEIAIFNTLKSGDRTKIADAVWSVSDEIDVHTIITEEYGFEVDDYINYRIEKHQALKGTFGGFF